MFTSDSSLGFEYAVYDHAVCHLLSGTEREAREQMRRGARQEDGWQNFRRTGRRSRKYKLSHLAACWNKHSDKAPDGFVMLVKDDASSAEFLPSILVHGPRGVKTRQNAIKKRDTHLA